MRSLIFLIAMSVSAISFAEDVVVKTLSTEGYGSYSEARTLRLEHRVVSRAEKIARTSASSGSYGTVHVERIKRESAASAGSSGGSFLRVTVTKPAKVSSGSHGSHGK